MPLISVLMSVFNGERYLRPAVESILQQTLDDFEFIILDDASSDQSFTILAAFADQDPRIVLVRNEENLGLTRSLNKGMALASGRYIARQDADDLALPDRLAKQAAVLEASPEVLLVSSDLEIIDPDGNPVERLARACDSELVPWHLLFHNRLGGHSQVMFRLAAALELGGYSEAYRYSQDYELWLRFSKKGEIVILPEVLQKWRRHEQGISAWAATSQETDKLAALQSRLVELLGPGISPAEIDEVRGFWTRSFPRSERAGAIHLQMKRLHTSFLQEQSWRLERHPDLPQKLKALIGRQFLLWALQMGMSEGLLARLTVSRYTLRWHPSAWFDFWLKYPGALLMRKWGSKVRRLGPKSTGGVENSGAM